MYRQIDVGCQTKDNPPHCNGCIFQKSCPSRVQNCAEKKETEVSIFDRNGGGLEEKELIGNLSNALLPKSGNRLPDGLETKACKWFRRSKPHFNKKCQYISSEKE
jgi:hypothetical protein